MIAYCGLTCDTCPIRLATLEQDKPKQKKMRELIAKQIRKQYGMDFLSENVTDCDGCQTNAGRLFSGCLNCEIRKCAIKKNIDNCAFCNDYACDLLEKHLSLDPSAIIRLEEIRNKNKA